jgi:flagellar hook-associated protein 1 FlgK
MAGLNTNLELGKNTLLVSQTLIQVASNNISNADNAAYARQKGVVTSNPAYRTASAWLGSGSTLDQVVQQRDRLIERQLSKSISEESEYTMLSSRLEQVAAYLEDDGETGLSTMLGEFWDSWETLNQNAGESEKVAVYESAQNLASSIRDLHSNLENLAGDFTQEISDTVDKANGLIKDIYDYNDKIAEMEASGVSANDMRDLRYETLTELSKIISFTYSEGENGALDITLSDSTPLITGSPPSMSKLKFEIDKERDTFSITVDGWKEVASYKDSSPYAAVTGDHGTVYQIDFSGEFKGMLEALNDTSKYIAMVDTFKDTLITQVNSTYSSDVFSRSNYFEVDAGFTQSSIDSSMALNMADLQEKPIAELGGISLGDYLSKIQQQLGTDQEYAIAQGEFKAAIREELRTQQQSVSGVSIDEETVDILKYQQMYQAASKVISITSEMMDTLIQMV